MTWRLSIEPQPDSIGGFAVAYQDGSAGGFRIHFMDERHAHAVAAAARTIAPADGPQSVYRAALNVRPDSLHCVMPVYR